MAIEGGGNILVFILYFPIRAIFDTVHKFFSSNANRKMLRDAIYDLKLVKLVLPDEN